VESQTKTSLVLNYTMHVLDFICAIGNVPEQSKYHTLKQEPCCCVRVTQTVSCTHCVSCTLCTIGSMDRRQSMSCFAPVNDSSRLKIVTQRKDNHAACCVLAAH